MLFERISRVRDSYRDSIQSKSLLASGTPPLTVSPCSRETRRLRRRNPPTTLSARRLRLTPKQLLSTTVIVPRRQGTITHPSPDPCMPRDDGAYIPASAAEPSRNPHLLASLPPRQRYTNQRTGPIHPDRTDQPPPASVIPS